MTSSPKPKSTEKLRERLDHLFDVVARLLAKRWSVDQQLESGTESDKRSEENSESPKAQPPFTKRQKSRPKS